MPVSPGCPNFASQAELSNTAQKSVSPCRIAEIPITCKASRSLIASMDIIQMPHHLRLSHASAGPSWLKISPDEN